MDQQQSSPKSIFIKAAIITAVGLVFVGVVALVYQLKNSKQTTTQVMVKTNASGSEQTTAETTPFDTIVSTSTAVTVTTTANSGTMQEFSLRSGLKITAPAQWKISLDKNNQYQEFDRYLVEADGENLFFDEINVPLWSADLEPDLSYGLSKEERAVHLSILQGISDNQKITPALDQLFSENAGEFFGYSADYRVGRSYFASQNQSFRGLTFFNTYGQVPGVAPVYHVSSYNPERKVILALYYGVFEQKPEIIEINKTVNGLMKDWEDAPAGSVEKADIAAHEAFKKLVETKPRSELSFGSWLNTIDAVMASVH